MQRLLIVLIVMLVVGQGGAALVGAVPASNGWPLLVLAVLVIALLGQILRAGGV